MPLKNNDQQFGTISKTFHWLMFIFIVGAIIGGNLDAAMPDGPEKGEALLMHKSFGFLILLMAVLRLGWKLMNPVPKAIASMTALQQKAATAVHWLLYALMIAQPVSGILMSQSAGYPVKFFNLFTVPELVEKNKQAMGVFHEVHETVWVLLTVLVVGHVLAAFHHHFIQKDDALKRMLRG